MSQDPFAPIPLFAIPLFSGVVSDAAEHREGLIRLIQEHRERSPGVVRSNRNGWHSGDDFMDLDDPHLRWVLGTVNRFATGALARYYNGWAHHEIRPGRYWANVLDKGGWNAPHHHVPNHWSGTYYVRVGELGTPPHDLSGMIEFLNPNPSMALFGRSGNYAIAPREGMILLFPSSLVHLVHPHIGESARISIAFNFDVVPKAGRG